jgi:hypothetical protein
MVAHYLPQAVRFPAGNHIVALTYDDPWIGYGLGAVLSMESFS